MRASWEQPFWKITEFCPSGFTQSASMAHAWNSCFQSSRHSRPQSPRSFLPVAGIESSGRTRFSEHAQSISFVLSTNQICQIWREVRELRTSGVGQSQSSLFLPQARRIVGSGDENGRRTNQNLTRHRQSNIWEKREYSTANQFRWKIMWRLSWRSFVTVLRDATHKTAVHVLAWSSGRSSKGKESGKLYRSRAPDGSEEAGQSRF